MAILKFKVIYANGQEKTVRVTPRAEVMAEEKYAGIRANGEAALRIVYYLAWASLSRSGQEPDDFEAFIDKIADVEDITNQADQEAADPTSGGEPSPAISSS